MRTLPADMTDTKVRELINAARAEPVTLLENGEPAAIVLSPAEFDRLDEQDRIRRECKSRLRKTIAAMQTEAKERGLTDEEAERLVFGDSALH